jgi:predicted aldo/keto reductase-like oxidoreductase
MRLPVRDEKDRSTVDIELVKKMVDRFMERGFTYFDTAHRYNDEASEPAIREALVKRYPRDRFVLANKITLNYIKKSENQEPFFRSQLAICAVDYFDNYLIHNIGAASYPAFAYPAPYAANPYGRRDNVYVCHHGRNAAYNDLLCGFCNAPSLR